MQCLWGEIPRSVISFLFFQIMLCLIPSFALVTSQTFPISIFLLSFTGFYPLYGSLKLLPPFLSSAEFKGKGKYRAEEETSRELIQSTKKMEKERGHDDKEGV